MCHSRNRGRRRAHLDLRRCVIKLQADWARSKFLNVWPPTTEDDAIYPTVELAFAQNLGPAVFF